MSYSQKISFKILVPLFSWLMIAGPLLGQRSKIVPVRYFSADGKRLVECGIEGQRSIQVFDAETGKRLLNRNLPPSTHFLVPSINYDGSLVAVGCGEGRSAVTYVIDVDRNKTIFTTNYYGPVQFSSDGKWMVVGSKLIRLEDQAIVSFFETGSSLQPEKPSSRMKSVFSSDSQHCIFFTHVGKRILVESVDLTKMDNFHSHISYKFAVVNHWKIDGRIESCSIDPSSEFLGVHSSVGLVGTVYFFNLKTPVPSDSQLRTIPLTAGGMSGYRGQSFAFLPGKDGPQVLTFEEKDALSHTDQTIVRERHFVAKIWQLEDEDSEPEVVFQTAANSIGISVFPRCFTNADGSRALFVIPKGEPTLERGPDNAVSFLVDLKSKRIIKRFNKAAFIDRSKTQIIVKKGNSYQIFSPEDGDQLKDAREDDNLD